MQTFDAYESNVRYYSRNWPALFASSSGSTIVDDHGTEYLDFFAGAGALSYGHNNPVLIEVAVEHLRAGKLLHSLDTYTLEKQRFLEVMHDVILAPRHMDMVIQTVGPTGATAVEAALQLARRITGAKAVVGFAGGYHGMTQRAAAVSASLAGRATTETASDFVALPYVEHTTEATLALLDQTLRSTINGERIGAVIIEPTQGEGGARPFDPSFLKALRDLCTELAIVVIADDIQAGVGRTGPFFSFEGSGLDPDVICVSKSISGLGLPMAVNLVRRSLDVWTPGEFTGTFRGNNLAFATSATMLKTYWSDEALEKRTGERGVTVREALEVIAATYGGANFGVRGNGLLCGLDVRESELATSIAKAAFDHHLIVETCGAGATTIKLLPPLVISDDELAQGLARLSEAVSFAYASR